VVNLDTKTVEVGGQRVHLTGKEYQMLELLSLRKGTTLTKEMFLNHLYGGMDEPELKIIDVFICKLRKKLANASGGRENYIEFQPSGAAAMCCAKPEFALIRKDCAPAAIALGLSLLGFVLPVASAIVHSANVIDCLIWAIIALIVQIAVYFILRIPVPQLSDRIANGEMAPALWLGLASLAAGVLNAASMVYSP
jgi:putative membrane protein